MKEKYKPFIYCVILCAFQGIMYLIGKLSPLSTHVVGNIIDNKIPFIPFFIYFYVSWYFMLFVVPMLFYYKDKKIFWKYVFCIFISIMGCFFIYVLYPTTMVRPDVSASGLIGLILKIVYWVDTPILNCFPSMHCLITFIMMFFSIFERAIKAKYKIIINIWGILIILSTVFVKQHVFIDIISAFILSIIVFVFVKLSKKIQNKIEKFN